METSARRGRPPLLLPTWAGTADRADVSLAASLTLLHLANLDYCSTQPLPHLRLALARSTFARLCTADSNASDDGEAAGLLSPDQLLDNDDDEASAASCSCARKRSYRAHSGGGAGAPYVF